MRITETRLRSLEALVSRDLTRLRATSLRVAQAVNAMALHSTGSQQPIVRHLCKAKNAVRDAEQALVTAQNNLDSALIVLSAKKRAKS